MSAPSTVFVALPDLRHNHPAFDALSRTFTTVHVASKREAALQELTALGEAVLAAVVGVKERVTDEILDALPGLRVLGSVGVGTDHLDLVALEARNVHLVTTPGVNAVSVAEHAMIMILSLAKRTLAGHTAVLSGRDRTAMTELPFELRGRRAGVLGAGDTARTLLPMVRAFGMETVVWTRSPETHRDLPVVELRELFQGSDVVSVHLPLTKETRGIVDVELLGLLPRGALVVNTARKDVIAPEALAFAATERPDLRFAIDDFGLVNDGTVETLGRSLLASPHMAGVTVEALRAMQDAAVRGIVRALST